MTTSPRSSSTSHALLLVSTCGTSILTNGNIPQELRKLLTRCANDRAQDINPAERAVLDAHILARRDALLKASEDEARIMSAELNGICAMLSQRRLTRVEHILIVSDTYLGRATGEMVQAWLTSNQGVSVQLYSVPDLQTRDLEGFRAATAALARYAVDTLVPYGQQGYHVAFNLTGGFKSVNGLMQSLGLLYADEVVYLFESREHADLIRIPRLPVTLDERAVDRNLTSFRLMAEARQELATEQCLGIPDALLDILDGRASLSVWGEALWANRKQALYAQELLPSPLPERIIYGPKLLGSFGNLGPAQWREINATIDQLAMHLLCKDAGKTYNPRTLDFKAFKVPQEGCTHECDVTGGKRFFINVLSEYKFQIELFGEGKH